MVKQTMWALFDEDGRILDTAKTYTEISKIKTQTEQDIGIGKGEGLHVGKMTDREIAEWE